MHRFCRIRWRASVAIAALYASPVTAQTNWKDTARVQADIIKKQQAQIDALSQRLGRLEVRDGAHDQRVADRSAVADAATPQTRDSRPRPPDAEASSTSISTAPISSILAAMPANGTKLPSRGFFTVPGSDAKLRIGGRVQVDAMAFPSAAPGELEDFIVPRLLNGTGPNHDRVRLTARDSRILTDFRMPAGALGGLRAYSEWDFMGTIAPDAQAQLSSYTPRLRHMFVEIGPGVGEWSFLAGQTWSAFNDVSAYADIYNGLLFGAVFERQPQIRATKWFGRKWAVSVSVENPEGDVSGATGADANTQFDSLPDLVVTTRTNQQWGTLQAGLLLRRIEETSPAGERFAWGVNLSGNIPVRALGRDNARFQVNYGTGIGRYIGELGPGFDGIARPSDGFGLINSFAANVSYQHFWSDAFHSSLAVSMVQLDTPQEAAASFLKRTRTLTANLVYMPVDSLEFGLEFTFADKETQDVSSVSRPFSRLTTRFTF